MEGFGYEKKISVMIVDGNSDFRLHAADELKKAGFEIVAATDDPGRAYDRLTQTSPDIVLFDMVLPGSDGIEFLREASKLTLGKNTQFIANSSIASEVIIKEIMRMGAVYYLVKPINFAILTERIRQICTAYASPSQQLSSQNAVPRIPAQPDPSDDLEKQVTDAILEIGIPAHVKGYHYVRSAIILAVEDPDVINAVTKVIYPTIAKEYKTSSSRVERAIRHAIEVAWDRGDVDVLNSIFGYSISSSRGKPTNSEFIAMIADRLRLRNKGRERQPA